MDASSVNEQISKVLSAVREQPSTRESSLVITKLQEAMMWQSEHERALAIKVRQSGVGFTPDIRHPQGPQYPGPQPPVQPPEQNKTATE